MNKLLYILIIALVISCKNSNEGKTIILIETTKGDITAELYPDKAPLTVAAFLKNIKEGIYNNSSFYRVVKSDPLPNDHNTGIIQGGVYGSGKEYDKIPHESTKVSGLSHTTGILSMARLEAGTASTEFFICIGDQSPLDYGRRGTADSLGMAAFGKVIDGMDVVRKIQNEPSSGDRFIKPIVIKKVSIE